MKRRSEPASLVHAEQNPVAGRSDVTAALAVTLLAQTTVSLLAATVAVLAPAIAARRGWNLSLITLYAPLLYIGAFSISFLVPWLLRKLRGMGLALAAIAVDTVGLSCLLSPWPAMAILAALLIGIGYGAMTPASSHVLGPRTTVRNAGMIMSVKQVGVPMGAMLAGLVIPWLVTRDGWQRAVEDMVLASAITAGALLPTVSWLNGLQAKQPASFRPLDPVRRLLATPGMAGVLAAALVYTAMQLCLRSLLPAYMVKDVGFGLGVAGLAMAVSQGGGMFGQISWAWLSDRVMTPRAVLAAVGAMMCVGALATASFSPQWSMPAIIVVAVVFGFSAGGFVPVILGEVARRSSPEQVGALTSGANLFIIAGAFMGPLSFGGIGAALSDRAAFVLLAVGAMITAVALVATGGALRQPDARPPSAG